MAEQRCTCPFLPPNYTTRLTSDDCLIHGYKHRITPEARELMGRLEARVLYGMAEEAPSGD